MNYFIAGQFSIVECPHSCIAHIFLRQDESKDVYELALSLDNCEFLIEELQRIIKKKVASVPIHPILKEKK